MTNLLTIARKGRRVRLAEPKTRRISPEDVARALGAETSTIRIRHGDPLSLAAVKEHMQRRLKSSGGRPALEDAVRKAKIPLSEDAFALLAKARDEVSEPGFQPTATQLAAAILEIVLRHLSAAELAEVKGALKKQKEVSSPGASNMRSWPDNSVE